MAAIKSILLHLDPTPGCTSRLAVAGQLAAQHDATVSALFAVVRSALQTPQLLDEGGAVRSAARDLDAERLRRAREMFDAARLGARVKWAEIDVLDVIPGFVRRALAADLLVLGQCNQAQPGTDGVPTDFAESVIIASGRPAIVVPYIGRFAEIGRRVLVAWKATAESARALAAALPLLERADRVHVASWGEDPRMLEGLLRLHGVDAQFHREGPAGAELGEYLLSRAAELEADLLVMGCYGHSRARELVLGGASRTVLDSMTLPVLMAH
jgi:nucleotide-binding universal stress UspA family protein